MKTQERKKTGGRVAGVPNKATSLVKDNLLAVFNRLGGTAAMADWASENKTEFYKIYAKLLPMQISGDPENPIRHSVTVKYVD